MRIAITYTDGTDLVKQIAHMISQRAEASRAWSEIYRTKAERQQALAKAKELEDLARTINDLHLIYQPGVEDNL